mmetsp:Transcript_27705/g.70177  ORF Transcript_27705/g.70177 Transcript_27705/m.70177 type:complete len:255 (+) Transcript_27705:175-939(+)
MCSCLCCWTGAAPSGPTAAGRWSARGHAASRSDTSRCRQPLRSTPLPRPSSGFTPTSSQRGFSWCGSTDIQSPSPRARAATVTTPTPTSTPTCVRYLRRRLGTRWNPLAAAAQCLLWHTCRLSRARALEEVVQDSRLLLLPRTDSGPSLWDGLPTELRLRRWMPKEDQPLCGWGRRSTVRRTHWRGRSGRQRLCARPCGLAEWPHWLPAAMPPLRRAGAAPPRRALEAAVAVAAAAAMSQRRLQARAGRRSWII